MFGIIIDFITAFDLIEIEPVFKVSSFLENLWHHEVKQAPQLFDVILQRCSSEQKSPARLNFAWNFYRLRLSILQFVSLVEGN